MIQPLGCRVLILLDETDFEEGEDGSSKTKSGIFVPELAAKKEQAAETEGRLVAIGDLAWSDKFYNGKAVAAVGDRVIYSRYSGVFVKDKETKKRYILINDEDILAKID